MKRVSSTPDLFIRGNSYIFKKAYPVHLRPALRQEHKRSLGKIRDISLSEAQRRAVETHREYEQTVRIQELAAPKVSTGPSELPSSDPELRDMARRYLGSLRNKKAKAKMEGRAAGSGGGKKSNEQRRMMVQLLRMMHSKGNFRPFYEFVGLFIESEGYKVEFESRDWNRLAHFLGLAYIENIERDTDLFEHKPEQTHDPLFETSAVEEAQQKGKRAGTTFATLVREYRSDVANTAKWSNKTLDKQKAVLDFMQEYFGQHTAVSSIDRAACRNLQKFLLGYPANAKKFFPGKSLSERVLLAEQKGKPPISVTTLNDYLGKLSTLFRWGTREGIILLPNGNPAEALLIPDLQKARKRRDPFSIIELRKIFGTLVKIDGELHERVPGPVKMRDRSWKFWIVPLGLYTGARANELGQLDVADVKSEGGLYYLDITDEIGDRTKRLKSKNARRVIPLHPELIRMGFLEYVSRIKKTGEPKLFPDLKPGAAGYRSAPISRWFSRHLKKTGAKTPKNCFHSFRHSFKDALRRAKVRIEYQKALCGWQGNETHEVYGGELTLEELHYEISKVEFEGLDLSHLYPGKFQ